MITACIVWGRGLWNARQQHEGDGPHLALASVSWVIKYSHHLLTFPGHWKSVSVPLNSLLASSWLVGYDWAWFYWVEFLSAFFFTLKQEDESLSGMCSNEPEYSCKGECMKTLLESVGTHNACFIFHGQRKLSDCLGHKGPCAHRPLRKPA